MLLINYLTINAWKNTEFGKEKRKKQEPEILTFNISSHKEWKVFNDRYRPP